MDYKFSYLILGLVFLIFWGVLYYRRKDLRKEMLIMSFLFGIAGIFAEILYLGDWWTPLTITNTAIGFEDFLFGFVVGGIASIIYEEIFNKKIEKKKETKKIQFKDNLRLAFFGIMFIIILYGQHYIFGINTFVASITTFILGIVFIYIKRKDLIKGSIINGFLVLGISIIVYTIINLITPGWIDQFWTFSNVPNIKILNIPIDDFVWYFLAGLMIGPLYEYWKELKLK